MRSRLSNLCRVATWIVVVHAAVVVVHGLAHRAQRIEMSLAANVFIVLVIVIGPFAALVLLRLGRHRKGALSLAATMAGSFLFGLWNHFLIHGADHIADVQDGFWKLPFQATAWLLLATEGAGCAIAFRILRAQTSPDSGSETRV